MIISSLFVLKTSLKIVFTRFQDQVFVSPENVFGYAFFFFKSYFKMRKTLNGV
jgi:hypothetical protein